MENGQSLLPKTSQLDSFWQYPWLRKTLGDFYKDLKLLAILELVYNHLSFEFFHIASEQVECWCGKSLQVPASEIHPIHQGEENILARQVK